MDFFSLAPEIYNHGQCECVCVFILSGCVCLGEEHRNIRVLNYSSAAVKFSHYMCRIHFRGERDVFSCKGKRSHISYRKITRAVSHSKCFFLCAASEPIYRDYKAKVAVRHNQLLQTKNIHLQYHD